MTRLRFVLAISVFFAIPSIDRSIAADNQDGSSINSVDQDDEFLHLPGILAWVDMPRTADLGEIITVKLTVVNARRTEDLELESIDIADSFLNGFELRTVAPAADDSDPTAGFLTLYYSVEIPPESEFVLILELAAVREGTYIGDLDVWDDNNFLTRAVQCVVIDRH